MSDFDIVREVLTWDSEARRHWDDDPFSALDRIESQNQALQEAYDALHEEQADTLRDLAALQERAEKAEAVVDVMHRTYHAGVSECPCLELLSPTQETDPE